MLPTHNVELSPQLNIIQVEEQSPQQLPKLEIQNVSAVQNTSENNNSNDISTNSQNSATFSERSWCDEKDQIQVDHAESLSFINIMITICLWIFLYICITGSVNAILGWFIFAFCYILYLVECTNCSLFKSLCQRKLKIDELKSFLNQYLNYSPEITYQINKVRKYTSNDDIGPSQIAADIESQNNQSQPESQPEQKEKKKKIKTQFQKNSINFEFEKITNECLSLESLINEHNAFKLNINIISKIINEQALNQWNQKKEEFKGNQESAQGAQILSTLEYSKFEEGQSAFYMKCSIRYYISIVCYSFLSLLGLSVLFRLFFNISVPTIRVQLEKKISN